MWADLFLAKVCHTRAQKSAELGSFNTTKRLRFKPTLRNYLRRVV